MVVNLLQYSFGNLFIYFAIVESAISIHKHKYKFNTIIDLLQYLFKN